jgi:hypothetical protein
MVVRYRAPVSKPNPIHSEQSLFDRYSLDTDTIVAVDTEGRFF